MTSTPTSVYWDVCQHGEWTFFVVATDTGLCNITLPNETFDTVQHWLAKHVPEGNLLRDPIKLRPYTEQIKEYLSGRRKAFSVPLDLRGTPFQKEVWGALLEIPFGETRSYTQIGEFIGNRAAVRAIGAANGANPLPIVVPCHRVIGKSGKLTGYRGGIPMKEKLLALEGL